jgi:hypothetical protein
MNEPIEWSIRICMERGHEDSGGSNSNKVRIPMEMESLTFFLDL